MQRYFIYLSYDGSAYHGWQVQPNGESVQATLQRALSTLLRREVEVTGAGRTDAGVHARLMVAHFDYQADEGQGAKSQTEGTAPLQIGSPCPAEGEAGERATEAIPATMEARTMVLSTTMLVDKLNRLLPPDIAVHAIRPVCPDAHARFSASSRTYQYFITTRKEPFGRAYRLRLFHTPDFVAMNEAASRLRGYTDFTSFSKLHTDVKTNNCRIAEARWAQVDDYTWVFTIRADRFLRNMVRAIVGTLLEVGRGRLTVDDFCRIVEQRDRCRAGTSVPGHALFLTDITYPEEIFQDVEWAQV